MNNGGNLIIMVKNPKGAW